MSYYRRAGVGRAYAKGCSLQYAPRGQRPWALLGKPNSTNSREVVEFDVKNSQPTLLWNAVKKYCCDVASELPFLDYFAHNVSMWGERTSAFLGSSEIEAKKIHLRAPYGGSPVLVASEGGGPGEVKNNERRLLMPHILMLSKDFEAARRLLGDRDEVYQRIYTLPRCHRGDTVPGRTALSLFLGTLKRNVLYSLPLSLKPIPGVTVRALVFDGLIATVSSSQEEVAECACREVIAAICAQYDVCIV